MLIHPSANILLSVSKMLNCATGISAEANVKCSINNFTHGKPLGVITSSDQRVHAKLCFITESNINMFTRQV